MDVGRGFWFPLAQLTQPQQLSFDVAVQDRDGDQTRDTGLDVVPGPRIDRGTSGDVALNEDALPVPTLILILLKSFAPTLVARTDRLQ